MASQDHQLGICLQDMKFTHCHDAKAKLLSNTRVVALNTAATKTSPKLQAALYSNGQDPEGLIKVSSVYFCDFFNTASLSSQIH